MQQAMESMPPEESGSSPAYHVPVMLKESVDALNVGSGIYIDATFGGGGHSREILRRMSPDARLFGFDQDSDAKANVPEGDKRFTFVLSNFRYLRNWMNFYGISELDGVLADLGVSSHHFDTAERGFTFRHDAPLDMRMNRNASVTAADFLNKADEERIAAVLHNYGELRNSRRMAAAIAKARDKAPLLTTQQLMHVLEPFTARDKEKKDMARAFQALRIEVNDEMGALKQLLATAQSMLRKGGRLVVLTYHSLEDRMVKNFIKSGNVDGKIEQDFYGNMLAPMKPVNTHVIVPDDSEVAANSRSRSAKLRVGEKK